MTSLVRPILSSILCCMIAFGHAPAWLHVANCEDGCGDAVAIAVVKDSGTPCSHGCCHHSSVASDTETTREETELPATPPDHHDSDTCAVCQSLAGSIGVVSLSMATLAPEYACEIFQVGADQNPIVASLSIAQPRGPPAVA